MGKVVRVGAISLNGLDGAKITVEAGASRQIPGLGIVGLPDAALNEAKQRVRHAAASTGLSLTDRFILINLQPADLPKHGSGFDLAIALAALAALQKTSLQNVADTVHIGELGLDGTVKRPRGLLASVAAAKKLGIKRVVIGEDALDEACLVDGITVIAVENLSGAVNWHSGRPGGWKEVQTAHLKTRKTENRSTFESVDISEIVGQKDALRALELAAIGKHHLHLHGPPGAGKTMLAKRLPGILPDLNADEAVLASSMVALTSQRPIEELAFRPSFVAPHHTASAPAIIGSAQGGIVYPGAISLASFGVLFLDEAQEYPATVLDALRQPLESGTIEIHRARMKVELPAAVQLVMASNPCPCGNGGSVKTVIYCTCTAIQLRRYQSRISGPLKDRMDLSILVDRVASAGELSDTSNDDTKTVRQRVETARRATAERLQKTPWKVNSEVPGSVLRSRAFKPSQKETRVLDTALEKGRITLRGYDRALRVAWSISDSSGRVSPNREDIAEALRLRNGRV